jgi:hypothetical protein
MVVDASDISTITPVPTTIQGGNNGGRYQGRGNSRTTGRGGFGRGSRPNNNNNSNDRTTGRAPTARKQGLFKGNTAEMNGHVFECFEESGVRTQFSKTVEILGEYISKKVKFPEDMKPLFTAKMVKPTIAPPADLDDEDTASKKELLMWEENFEVYFKRKTELEGNLMTTYAVIWRCLLITPRSSHCLLHLQTGTESNFGHLP